MSKDYKIVFVDDVLPISPHEREIIGRCGWEVRQHSAFTTNEILAVARDADAIMTVSGDFSRATIEGLEKCRVIGRYGMGVDNVDLQAATEKGIVVNFVPVYCSDEVATLSATLVLALSRKLQIADRVVKEGHWENSVKSIGGAFSIQGKTLGILGFGKIGQTFAPLMKPFGVELITYDPYIDLGACERLGVSSVDREELLRRSDIIYLQMPLIPETWHNLGKAEFDMMKDGVVIVNTGRGALIDQEALKDALRSGKVGGAGLDVLEFEPPDPDDELFRMENVITSGHIGAATTEAIIRLRRAVAQGIVDVLEGRRPAPPAAVANRDVLEKLTLR